MKIQNSTVKTNLIETGSSSKTRPSQANKKEPNRRGFLKLVMAASLAAAASCKTYAQPKAEDGYIAEEAEMSLEEAAEKIKEAKLKYGQALPEIDKSIVNFNSKISELKKLDPETKLSLSFEFKPWRQALASQKDLPAENVLERYIAVKKEISSYLEAKKDFFKTCKNDLKRPKSEKSDDIDFLKYQIIDNLMQINHSLQGLVHSLINEAQALQDSSPQYGKLWNEQQENIVTMLHDLNKLFD